MVELVAFGRNFVLNPDLVERIGSSAPLNEFQEKGMYAGDETGYADYPTLG